MEYEFWKRIIDFNIAVVFAIVTAPILLFTIILVKITSKGPVFYFGKRSGLNGVLFNIVKVRTMVVNAENLGGASTALNDKRLILVGRFLRKYKLDELPQIYNIIKGDMSFVGPRPQVEKYTKLYKGDERVILTIKPGLTDFATIEFIDMDKLLGSRKADEIYQKEIEPKKNILRIKYVKERSFLVDLKILFNTAIHLFRGFFK